MYKYINSRKRSGSSHGTDSTRQRPFVFRDPGYLATDPDNHVCNSIMLSRFTRTHPAGPRDTLTAGTQSLPIECFGTIQITICTFSGPQTMTLLNVAYVSNFMINIVFQDLLYDKGLYFESCHMRLHREGKTDGLVEWHNGLNSLQRQSSATAASTTATKTVTMKEWHQGLGLAAHDAIQHLENSVGG